MKSLLLVYSGLKTLLSNARCKALISSAYSNTVGLSKEDCVKDDDFYIVINK